MATFYVKGISPLGRIVELLVVAENEADARQQAASTGLRFVVVKEQPGAKQVHVVGYDPPPLVTHG